jgi:hypothetical protein
MSTMDIFLLVVSLIVVTGISALWPWAAWQDYKYEKARNDSFRMDRTNDNL